VCPRAGGAHTPYAYWPVSRDAVPISPLRIKRFYTASRIISAYEGTITSCNEISGKLTGPDAGKLQLDGRVGGCIRTNGSDETACPDAVIDSFDQTPQQSSVDAASFTVRRLTGTSAVTCATVRAFDFD